jgi:hypothetical protein
MSKRYWIISIIIALSFFLALPGTAFAEGAEGDSRPLCPPDLYFDLTQDCNPFGPTAYLLEMAEVGFTFPETPLPIQKPDSELSNVDFTYAYVLNDYSPIYLNLNDAAEDNGKRVVQRTTPGFTYISIQDSAYRNGKYVHFNGVGWISGEDVVITPVPKFQGVEFNQTPEHEFGWILAMFAPGGKAETKRTPGYDLDDYTGRYLDHQQLVQIYDTVKVGNWDWYMIGPDEWLVQRTVAKVTPRTEAPEGNTWERWIEVNLYEQTVAVYEDNELVFATLIASGVAPLYTYPGTFQIEEKEDLTGMRNLSDPLSAYNLQSVPWTMYFDESRAFHGAYWRASFGYPQSHGCVNLSVGDSHWLYQWAEVGDWVYVYDPSGKTPYNNAAQ